MLVSYPALFYFDETQSQAEAPYFVYFPDFNAVTQGRSVADAVYMASDQLGILLADYLENNRALPQARALKDLSLELDNPFQNDSDFELVYDKDESFIAPVVVNVAEYLKENELVKKTLTIPKWANRMGQELGLNFSQTLTDAIMEKKFSSYHSS